MSETRGARFALTVLAALAVCAGGAGAQEATPSEAELLRRIRALEPGYEAADAAADRADEAYKESLRAGMPPQAVVEVGPFRIVTTEDQVTEARLLWGAEWATFEPIVGRQAAKLTGLSFLYHRKPRVFPYDAGHVVRTVEFRRPVSDERVSRAIHDAIGAAVNLALPPDVSRWTGQTGLGAYADPRLLFGRFVTAPSTLAQGCMSGSNESCWTAFGQMDPSADIVSTWFPQAEQRALVASGLGAEYAQYQTNSAACVDDGVAASCREIVEFEVLQRGVMPYPAPIRANLLWFALERGGPGSLDRLAASVETDENAWSSLSDRMFVPYGSSLGVANDIRTHLGRAAGMDPDVLIEQWRREVLAGRPGAPTPDERSRASTTLWITLFAALATRSKRWRLG